jgi:hypothetical protein
VVERQPGHRLVRHLGVDAAHVRPRERGDEVQRVADGRQEDVAARLVRLGLDRERHREALRDRVVREHVDRLAVALQCVARVLGRADLGALAAAPEDEHLRVQAPAEVDRPHRLADRRAPHAAVVGGERAVLERRVAEQVRRRHPNAEAGLGEGRLQAGDDPLLLVGRRAPRDEVVVVQGDPPRAQLGEAVDCISGVQRGAGRLTERVATRVADGPQSECEAMFDGHIA